MNKKILQEQLPDKWTQDIAASLEFAPLTLRWSLSSGLNRRWDALVKISEDAEQYVTFGVEYNSDASPQRIALASMQAREWAQNDRILPLLVSPFLSEERLIELEKNKISAIDLCGNGIVMAPGQFYVFRSGYPNRFTSSRPLKNIYRRVSSLAARTFLLRHRYAEIRDLQQEIARRGGDVSLPTLSKVICELEQELIVQRSRQPDKPQSRALRLLQPTKLLTNLEASYVFPKIDRSFVGKVAMEPEVLRRALQENARVGGSRMIATGLSSAGRYATLAMENTLYVYTTSLDALLSGLPATATSRFPNLNIQQTQDATAFFDPRPDEDGFPWASALTTYLELMHGEERLQQTATQIRETLLASM